MRKTFLPVMLILLAAPGLAVAGKVYKWVDKDGHTHYTNTPPPEASQAERTVLDENGNVTETLAAPKTAEEIAAAQQEAAEKADQERLAREQADKDNMLLQTYTTVGEMEMARDGRLAALDAQVKVVSGTISSLEIQLAAEERQAANFTESGKPVPEALAKKIESTRAELLRNQQFLLVREEDQQQIHEKFAADIARFKDLKGIQ